MINTKRVLGRRQVRYSSFDKLLADSRQMASIEVRTLGNWSQGQIYEHLARLFNVSIDGMGFALPAPVRWIMTLLMKRKLLQQGMPAGFKSMRKLIAEETSAEVGLASLQSAIERQQREEKRVLHPAFGNIGREGWDQFNLRHAELHMSYLVSTDQATN